MSYKAIALVYADVIILTCVPSVPSLFRAFIMKRCGILLAFSAPTEMIMSLLSLRVIYVLFDQDRTCQERRWKEPWAKGECLGFPFFPSYRDDLAFLCFLFLLLFQKDAIS